MNAAEHPLDPAIAQHVATRDTALDWHALESLMHRDAGGRGLASDRVAGRALDAGQLQAAALDLARRADRVAIVTGFPIVLPERVTAETDGPPGALFLADALRSLEVEVTLVTDHYALPLLAAGCDQLGIERDALVEFPFDETAGDSRPADRWIEEFFARGRGQSLSHLIAIERPGPSHTLSSLAAQRRTGDAPLDRFGKEVPEPDRNVCHDMRGTSIEPYTAPVHRLFDVARGRIPAVTTIGIGDGGNEIGMGCFRWEDLARAIAGDAGGRIACRTATDYALIAGVSNWGGYALGLACGWLRGVNVAQPRFEPEAQRELIAQLVAHAGAVDGRTRRDEPTVDGLSPDEHLAPLAAMHAIVARAEDTV